MNAISFDQNGFAVVPDVIDAELCATLRSLSDEWSRAGAGTRSLLASDADDGPVRCLARRLMGHPVVSGCLPSDPVAVQCTFFRKVGGQLARGGANWFVPWHQDGSLPCRPGVGRVEVSRWSIKEGEAFVAAPAEVLETVVAVRVHLDDSREDNGPLLVWPGSHRAGLLRESELDERSKSEPRVACTVPAGGAIVMRPLLVHSSRRSQTNAPRRVLHFLFGPTKPPWGLQWNVAVGGGSLARVPSEST
jgi:hypothetical protein